MPKLASAITVTARFIDASGETLVSKSQEMAGLGQPVPLVIESVLLKAPVPVGARFEISLHVGDVQATTYCAAVPVPPEFHEELGQLFHKSGLFLVSYSKEGDASMPKWSFKADIWLRLRVTRSGFTELELHVGQEGIGTPKWVNSSQFWTRVE